MHGSSPFDINKSTMIVSNTESVIEMCVNYTPNLLADES